MLDGGGTEALLVLDLHRVEGATIGVNAHEEVARRLQLCQGPRRLRK